MRRHRRNLIRAAAGTAALLVLGAAVVATANLIVLIRADGDVHSLAAESGPATVAIVLGAQVKPDGTMSAMLADRVSQGAALWREGKVERILVSGDHGAWRYDEPTTMRRAMIRSGVPADAIFTDHAGFDTRASMERARKIFGIRDAIIVTQGFHMKRALYLARNAGIEADGLTSDLRGYGGQAVKSSVREIASRVKAVLESTVNAPVTGGPPVPITGPARASWGPAAPPDTPPAGAPGPDRS
ncbi:MAG: YdcF family protein [Actinomycetota bacterium]|nr:YdcF family protein [Actinomycetota bacterium]